MTLENAYAHKKTPRNDRNMKQLKALALIITLACTLLCACSPYRAHTRVAKAAKHHVAKPPMSLMDFGTRGRGCGCH